MQRHIGVVSWDRGQLVIYDDHIEVQVDDPYYNGELSPLQIVALLDHITKMSARPSRVDALKEIESDVAMALHELTYFEGRLKQDDAIGILKKQRERIKALLTLEILR